MLNKLFNQLQNLIKRGAITLPTDDSLDFAITQVQYLNKTASCEVISPYGLFANLPVDASAIVFNFNALEENKGCIGYLQQNRFKNLEEGEVQTGNPFSNAYIKYDKGGNINMSASGNTNIEADGNIFSTTIVGSTTGTNANVFINPTTGQLQRSVSSIRYKKNVVNATFDADSILSLVARKFNMINNGNEDYYGFIAEEVNEMLPECVVKNSDGLPDSIDFNVITAALVMQVQSLSERIKTLEEQIL